MERKQWRHFYPQLQKWKLQHFEGCQVQVILTGTVSREVSSSGYSIYGTNNKQPLGSTLVTDQKGRELQKSTYQNKTPQIKLGHQ